MIIGKVNAQREAVIPLTVRGYQGAQETVQAIVDTGFDGWLSLPPEMIRNLKLPWMRRGSAQLADGSETVYDSYAGEVTWHRRQRHIPIDEVNAIPLVGMALLDGYKLTVEVTAGGKVTITELE